MLDLVELVGRPLPRGLQFDDNRLNSPMVRARSTAIANLDEFILCATEWLVHIIPPGITAQDVAEGGLANPWITQIFWFLLQRIPSNTRRVVLWFLLSISLFFFQNALKPSFVAWRSGEDDSFMWSMLHGCLCSYFPARIIAQRNSPRLEKTAA